MANLMQRKPRFLCLHGFRTSGEILKKQLRRWPESVLDKLDLFFIDAPFPAEGESGFEGIYDPPYYEWYQSSEDYSEHYNFDECVAYIEECMMKHGPFDGLLGFSQGAILAAALTGMQLHGAALTKVPKIKFVVIITGSKLGGQIMGLPKMASTAFSSVIECPSIHLFGEKEFVIELSVELLDSFQDPFVICHREGHTVPKLEGKDLETMLSFIEKIEKIHLQHNKIYAAL